MQSLIFLLPMLTVLMLSLSRTGCNTKISYTFYESTGDSRGKKMSAWHLLALRI